jgi:gamma-glutamyltranspeptidase/glutathione hydrolase
MFALTVVEPMMVTIFGAGFVNIRWADGTCMTIDNYVTIPAAARPDMYEPIPGSIDHGVIDRLNEVGHLSVATGGTLLGWCTAIEKYGRLPLRDVMAPAIRFARHGFATSAYMRLIVQMNEEDMRRYPDTARVFLPGGSAPEVGDIITRPEYADTLAAIAEAGPDYLYHGPLGRAIADDMAANGGLITMEDIDNYRIYERPPVRGTYRGFDIIALAPPSSGGAHIVQMLNIFEGCDVGAMGFGSPDSVHLAAEAMKIAFADRYRYMADPLTAEIPLEWLTSKEYGAARRAAIDMAHAQQYSHGLPPDAEHESTTHCCAMDAEGNVVATTTTLHMGFGSKVTVPGTGMLLNDCMQLMDPTPGHTNSIAPNKRILSSMSPTIVLRDGQPFMTVGTPGGLKIFGAVFQAIVNVIDHGMSLQQAVEAARCWDRGPELELEFAYPGFEALKREMERRGHVVAGVEKVAGGMNGIMRDPETGMLEGAACWRADGAPIGVSGGPALVGEDIRTAMWE